MEEIKELRRFTITGIEGEKPTPAYSHRISSEYVEDQWLAYLGPDAIIFARRVNRILETEHKYAVDIPKWAEIMGIKPDNLLAACHRLVRYGLAHWSDRDPMLSVSRYWPEVPAAIATPLHRAILTDLPDLV